MNTQDIFNQLCQELYKLNTDECITYIINTLSKAEKYFDNYIAFITKLPPSKQNFYTKTQCYQIKNIIHECKIKLKGRDYET